MRHFLALIISFSLIFSAYATDNTLSDTEIKQPTYRTSFADIVAPLMPAVVNIYTVKYYNKQISGKGGSLQEIFPFEKFNDFFEQYNIPFSFEELYSNPRATSLGSGFLIDEDGLIVTNNHVIAGSDEIHIKLSDNMELPALVIGTDPKTDLALLKIDSKKKLPFINFGNSSESRIGDVVIAIGNPLGFGGTVTTGIISSKGRDLGIGQDELVDDFIQTDAAINAGNSGGPLFNIKGEVIGVNTSIPAVSSGTNIGIGFAIPSNTVQDIITQLKKSGKINRGRLDIAIQEVTTELADTLALNKKYGVLVVDVRPAGSGEKAGLKRGDLITEFNEKKVLNSRKLQLFVAETHIGENVNLTVLRNGEIINLITQITESETEQPVNETPETSTIEKSGFTFSDLSPNLITKFNLTIESKGVVIVKLPEQEASNLDLKVGDLVLAINHQLITDVKQFSSLYDQVKTSKKKSVVLLVKRRNFTMFAPLPIK